MCLKCSGEMVSGLRRRVSASPPSGYLGDVISCPWLVNVVVQLDLYCVFEGDELAGKISMFIPCTATVFFCFLMPWLR